MASTHAADLYVPGTSPLHRTGAPAKIAGTVLFVFAVALIPREAFWAFGVAAAVALAIMAVARLRPRLVMGRMAIEIPFVAFAALLPLFGAGERVEVVGLSLSVEGLWAAWNVLARATLGVAASVVLASTTQAHDLLAGLGTLHVPRPFVAIAGFMLRYTGIVADDLSRMRRSMTSRGYNPRLAWQARPLATSLGALFVRSYERGERVQNAMLARGFDGALARSAPAPRIWTWLLALVPALTVAGAALVAWRFT